MEYKTLHHRVHNFLQSSHCNYLQNAINSASDTANCKSFWRYIKSKHQDFTGIGSLKTPYGDIVTEPFDKAEIIYNHFKSVYTLKDQQSVSDMGVSLYPSIASIEITLQGAFNLLANCNSNKSPGPDIISSPFLKNTANEIAQMLTHLFRQSLTRSMYFTIRLETHMYFSCF